MSNFEGERAAIEALFQGAFVPPVGVACPIEFENVAFTEPATRTWVRLTVINGASDRRAVGTPALIRTVGIIAVMIFTPSGAGSSLARQIADCVVAALQEKAFRAGSDYCSTTITSVKNGRVQPNGCWGATCFTPYQRDE